MKSVLDLKKHTKNFSWKSEEQNVNTVNQKKLM